LAEFCIDATAGAIGEIMSGALWVPADLVSQRLMLQGPDRSKHLYTGMTDAVTKIWRAEGARGFYVGFGASLLTHIPNSATCWAVYEYSKKQLYRHWWWPRQGIQPGQSGSERTDGSHFVNMISAVLAGVVASAVSTPFDVIRVRKQAEGLSAALYSAPAAGAAATSAAPNQTQQSFHDARSIAAARSPRCARWWPRSAGPGSSAASCRAAWRRRRRRRCCSSRTTW
jgi:hypothetical protein